MLQPAKPIIDIRICACLVASYLYSYYWPVLNSLLAHNLANWNLKKIELKEKLVDAHDSRVNLLETKMRAEIVARFSNLPVQKTKKTKGRNFLFKLFIYLFLSFFGSLLGLSVNPCEGFVCSHQGESCVVKRGKAACVCNKVCTREYEPYCASDGNTYSNNCTLQLAACESGESLTIVHPGECGG